MSEASRMKIAGVQMDIKIMEPELNLANMEKAMRETTANGAELTVFPECAVTGYCFSSLAEAMPWGESIPGKSSGFFQQVCAETNSYVVYGTLEKEGEQLFNVCVLVGPSGVIGSYRKIPLPFLGIDRFTTPGNRPFEVYDIGKIKVGMNICYDGSFPESSRIMALDGADLVVLPTNWPPGAETFPKYIVNTRAVENKIFYAAVNRVGMERGFQFIGGSKIISPNGDDQHFANHQEYEILYGTVVPEDTRNKHIVRVPDEHEIHRFDDRHPEWYSRITDQRDLGEL